MPDSNRPAGSEEMLRRARKRLESSEDAEHPIPESPGVDARPSLEPKAPNPKPILDEASTEEAPAAPAGHGAPPAPSKSRGWVRWAVTGALLLGYFLFTVIDDAGRDDSGQIVEAGDLDVMTIQVGDCFNDPEEFAAEVSSIDAVPCAEPHDNEVFALVSVESDYGSDYPGQARLEDHSFEICAGPAFADYVGTTYSESALDVFTFTPTQDSWGSGDREIVCVLYRLDRTRMNGSAQGSEL